MIMRLPQGYETDIGEGGLKLSGGQRQRLGLARAFFGSPRLIVLDEPNASLDAEGEEALRQALQEMRDGGATIVIIAQRLGILNLSDKILVLDSGLMNAFGKRREIAEKIRSGRTVIPVRNPPVIPGGKRSARPANEESSEPLQDAAAQGPTAESESERAVS
jgi:ABC-type protease/lipase transport system fused ATPase/permease subunit